MFETLSKITLLKNAKTPIHKWSDKANHHTNIPDMNKYNVGILTGEINNLWVLDVDVKDDGVKTWNEYMNNIGMDINTVKAQTPSGGFPCDLSMHPPTPTTITSSKTISITKLSLRVLV